MNDQQINPNAPFAAEFYAIWRELERSQADWQDRIGFGAEGTRLRTDVAVAQARFDPTDQRRQSAEANLRNYYIAKLALITTEAAEAIEEIRHNRRLNETYYSGPIDHDTALAEGDRIDLVGNLRKPEGVPSELADIVIRVLSLCGETGIDLAPIIVEKLNYNATRAQRHGGKAI